MPCADMWMDLENSMLSEISQTEKHKYFIIYMWNLKNKNEYSKTERDKTEGTK